MSTSTIPSVKAALVTRLQADAGLSGVAVTYGVSNAGWGSREWVWVGSTRGDDPTRGGQYGPGQSSAAMGQKRREERYVLELMVRVLQPSQESQQTTTERAFTLAAVVEASLRSWSTDPVMWSGLSLPSGASFGWALVTGLYHDEGLTGDGGAERFCNVYIDVACAARI